MGNDLIRSKKGIIAKKVNKLKRKLIKILYMNSKIKSKVFQQKIKR